MVLLAVHEKCTKPQAYNVRKGLTATKPTAVTAAPFTYSGQLLLDNFVIIKKLGK